MKSTFHLSIIVGGLLGCCSGARAEMPAPSALRPSIVPVRSGVQVKEVKGLVEYAYEGTGWRTLSTGKQLKAGATIRAGAGSGAIVRVDQRPTFIKVSSETSVHITTETPVEERVTPVLAIAGLNK